MSRPESRGRPAKNPTLYGGSGGLSSPIPCRNAGNSPMARLLPRPYFPPLMVSSMRRRTDGSGFGTPTPTLKVTRRVAIPCPARPRNPSSLRLAMQLVRAAARTVLPELNPPRIVAPVLLGHVVPLAALRALECDHHTSGPPGHGLLLAHQRSYVILGLGYQLSVISYQLV